MPTRFLRPHPPHVLQLAGALSVAVLTLVLSGCAHYKQTQYFEVVSPPDENGMASRNFYRMTIEGGGDLQKHMKMNAAYLSNATVDTLTGKTPKIGTVDMPEANEKAFGKIKDSYLDALKGRAAGQAGLAKASAGANGYETSILDIARQAWFSSLSDADLTSMGALGSSDPYAFRKLTFWISGETIELKEFGDGIDSLISNIETLAGRFKAKKEQEDQERQQHKEVVQGAAGGLIDSSDSMSDAEKAALKALFGIKSNSAPADSSTTP